MRAPSTLAAAMAFAATKPLATTKTNAPRTLARRGSAPSRTYLTAAMMAIRARMINVAPPRVASTRPTLPTLATMVTIARSTRATSSVDATALPFPTAAGTSSARMAKARAAPRTAPWGLSRLEAHNAVVAVSLMDNCLMFLPKTGICSLAQ